MTVLRVIGDVHAQIDAENLLTRNARPYLDIIADVDYSIQVGDMGDGKTYDELIRNVDAGRHRFVPGNHEKYDRLPPHSLGDFGLACSGGVNYFFIRGAASNDRLKLIDLQREVGRQLWFEEEELTDQQMRDAAKAYLQIRPEIVITHDAPIDIARFACEFAHPFRRPSSKTLFQQSRTNEFFTYLQGRHAPKLWLFGHHHQDWQYRENETLFVCVGELSHVDIDSLGNIVGRRQPYAGIR